MATAQLEKVQALLTCTICANKYSDPCTLDCHHTFCRKCITDDTKSRRDSHESKTIQCPTCHQVTKVPKPSSPIERWAWQIKPSIIILALLDALQTDRTTGRTCSICGHLGEKTRATSWCPECEMALCERCTKIHHVNPASRNHNVCDVSLVGNIRRKRNVPCHEHKKDYIKFHCKDCKKSACRTCCDTNHRGCKDVVSIESMRKEMTSELNRKRSMISKTLETKIMTATTKRNAIKDASKNKLTIQSQIRSVTQKAINMIKDKEEQLMDRLDKVMEKQMSQLQRDMKLEEIQIQMYSQHCEFIDQAVNSECVIDIHDIYQVCESGFLMLDDVGNNDTSDTQVIEDITFTHNKEQVEFQVDDLLLGEIKVRYNEDRSKCSIA